MQTFASLSAGVGVIQDGDLLLSGEISADGGSYYFVAYAQDGEERLVMTHHSDVYPDPIEDFRLPSSALTLRREDGDWVLRLAASTERFGQVYLEMRSPWGFDLNSGGCLGITEFHSRSRGLSMWGTISGFIGETHVQTWSCGVWGVSFFGAFNLQMHGPGIL